MVEPLRKPGADGYLYCRRAKVEKELQTLAKLQLPELVTRAREGEESGRDVVSSEVLVHVLRREARKENANGPGIGADLDPVRRSEASLKRHMNEAFDELQREGICSSHISSMSISGSFGLFIPDPYRVSASML